MFLALDGAIEHNLPESEQLTKQFCIADTIPEAGSWAKIPHGPVGEEGIDCTVCMCADR